MSLKTWLDEFYTDPAEAAKSELTAIEHAIRKYTGALKENLDRHEVFQRGSSVVSDGRRFHFDLCSCALCLRHGSTVAHLPDCAGCSLGHIGKPCFDDESVYGIFHYKEDPLPMLAALDKAKTYVLTHNGKPIAAD